MKKLVALLLALVMCLSLAACGGPDRQPAIDAFNAATDAFNEAAAKVNENLDAFTEENITDMNNMADLLEEYKNLLESDEELDEEKLEKMIEWFGTVEEWADGVSAAIGE